MSESEHIGVAEIKLRARRADDDEAYRERLFATVFEDQGRESSNAAWVLTHMPKDANNHIATHRDGLVKVALETDNTSLRRLAMALLERVEWDIDDVRTDLLDFCLLHIVDGDEAYGVRALSVKLAWLQCRHYPELCAELRQTLLLLDPATLKPGLKHTYKKTLEKLKAKAIC